MASSVTATTYPSARNDATESKLEAWSAVDRRDGVIWGATNTLALFADSTGMHVKLPSGSVLLGGVRGDLASQTTLDIATAHASLNRIDTVVAHLDRTSPYTITYKVVTGTASGSPTAPALVNTSTITEFLIGAVQVDAAVSTIAAAKVIQGRIYTTDTGWFNVTSTPGVTSGSTMAVSAWTQEDARSRFDGMTCHFYMQGALTLTGTSGGGLLIPLPVRAASYDVAFSASVLGLACQCYTVFDSNFKATYAEVLPSGSDTFPMSSAGRLRVAGTYEIYPE